jgi:hypothetical protein
VDPRFAGIRVPGPVINFGGIFADGDKGALVIPRA